MEKGFYHPERGYWQTNSEPSQEILDCYPDNTIEVPLKPSGLHTFDGKEWIPPTQDQLDAVAAEDVRLERNYRLSTDVDPIAGNALRWAALTAEQQQAWATYRQALLDVPSQAGFPYDITWPTKPE